MPYKYLKQKGIDVPKQKYKVTNWSNYNESLRQRGNIEVWLYEDIIDNWYNPDRVYDGTSVPDTYTNLAIITVHEIRKVFRLPLRQTQGFINSLFIAKGFTISCPDYSTLSKRLKKLNIKCPKFLTIGLPDENIAAVAIDSTGLKRFGRNEWHQEKYNISAKRSWRKLHIAVNDEHYIRANILTDRFNSDDSVVEELIDQIPKEVEHFTLNGVYDKNPVYEKSTEHSTTVVIPPAKNAVLSVDNHAQRNRNIMEIKQNGRMDWQRNRNYGQRNYSELSIQRYKHILGNTMQSRGFSCQVQKAMISCGVLNKMTSLEMPKSIRIS